jgi:hypothetical protein
MVINHNLKVKSKLFRQKMEMFSPKNSIPKISYMKLDPASYNSETENFNTGHEADIDN